jgi:hypothetical protein
MSNEHPMSTSNPLDLIGRWDIIAWEQLFDDGRRELPMGDQLEGFIRYLPDGDMVCMIARSDRDNFVKGGQWNAPADEKAGAYQSMLAYSGRWRLDGDIVTHSVQMSLFPNWKGGEQKRRVQPNTDGTIALTARLEDHTPQARTARLVWRRHTAA